MSEVKLITITVDELRDVIRSEVNAALEKFKGSAPVTDRLMTVAEVAKRISCSDRYVYKLEEQGKIKRWPTERRSVRFSAQHIEEYMKGK